MVYVVAPLSRSALHRTPFWHSLAQRLAITPRQTSRMEATPQPDKVPLTPQQLASSKPSVWNKGFFSPPPRNGCRYRLRWAGKGLVFVCLLVNALIMIRLSLFRPMPSSQGLLHKKQEVGVDERRLAVVVPAHGGDLRRALASLARWPKACSPVTLRHVELVLYYAGAEDDSGWSDDVLPELEQTGGRCFARTSVVFGNLTDEVRMQQEIMPHASNQHHVLHTYIRRL